MTFELSHFSKEISHYSIDLSTILARIGGLFTVVWYVVSAFLFQLQYQSFMLTAIYNLFISKTKNPRIFSFSRHAKNAKQIGLHKYTN